MPFQSGRNWRHRAPGKLKRGLKLLQSRESRSFQLVNCNEVMVGGSCFLCEVAAYDEELVGVIYIYIHIHTYIYYIYMYIYIYMCPTPLGTIHLEFLLCIAKIKVQRDIWI